jgi:hypothetical protein
VPDIPTCPNEHLIHGYYGDPTGCTVEQCNDLLGAVLRFRTERDEARAELERRGGAPTDAAPAVDLINRARMTVSEALRLIDHMALALGEVPPAEEAPNV